MAAPKIGTLVRHPSRPEWGQGRVDEELGTHVMVTFDDLGKVLVNTEAIALEIVLQPETTNAGTSDGGAPRG